MDSLLLHQVLSFLFAIGVVFLLAFFFYWRRRSGLRDRRVDSLESDCHAAAYCEEKGDSERPPVPGELGTEGGVYCVSPELRESRLALQESEAYLRTLYNNILDPAFLVDYETKLIVDSNQAARDLYGYTAEEFLLMTPKDLSLEKEETARVLESQAEQVRVLKRKHCKKNGEPIWVEAQLSVFERKGKKYNIINLRDITEQVEMQEASEKNYQRLVEAQKIAKIGNWEYYLGSNRCWGSKEANRIFGHKPDADGFVAWEDVLEHIADGRDLMRAYNEFLQGKLDMITVGHDIVAHDGSSRSIEFIAKLMRDSEHKPKMLYGTVEDITDRRDLEKQLQNDARREAFLARCLRLMLKSNDVDHTVNKIISEVGDYFEADEVVVFNGGIKDKESVLTYFWGGDKELAGSKKGYRVDHTKSTAWLGQLMEGPVVLHSLNDLVCQETRERLKSCGVQAMLAAPILIHREMCGRIDVVYYRENAKLSQRDALLLETLARIISLGVERNQREQAIVDERNRAEAASQAKSEFLANMSHEIRTPMTAILGFADVLASTHSEDERDEAIHIIRKNGQFLLKVINDILDFSKIEANRIDLEKKTISLPTFLGEIESLVSVSTREKGLEFRLDCPEPIPETIVTDPLRLKQILLNLLGNAIKFTHKGHVTVGAKMVKKSGKTKLEFSVRDSGVGIPSEQIPCLFEPFTQADSSVTRRFGGTGLGLTISSRLTEMLGGMIRVISEEGKGSTFIFDIDPGTMGAMMPYRRISVEGGEASVDWEAARLDDLNILLVEDGPDNQRLISLVLRKAGAKVTIAGNGKEACEMVALSEQESKPFDVVLMDMQMPIMDGYTATRKIRKAGHEMPIFALTAHALEHDRQKCLDAGCNDYISKPIQVKELLGRIAEVTQVELTSAKAK